MARRVVVLEKVGVGTWKLAFWLNVPAARQPFYKAKYGATPSRVLPEASMVGGITPSEASELANGLIFERIATVSDPTDPTPAELQAIAQTDWMKYQAEVTAYNPWAFAGTSWDGASWTQRTVS